MKLNSIFEPIMQDIDKLQLEIESIISEIEQPGTRIVFDQFFKKRGKNLRPALLFLSAKAIGENNNYQIDNGLIKLALVLELLHSASLVHDDIIDGDFIRRGEDTLNHTYGNKIAVLVGDTFFSYSFAIISSLFPKEYSQAITNLSLKMCLAEIEQAKGIDSREKYFEVIEGKTARFMSVCCELGAKYGGATESQIKLLKDFGMYFGMAYQIKDDFMDSDSNAINHVTLEEAYEFAKKAKLSISKLEDSIYKRHLSKLVEYVMSV